MSAQQVPDRFSQLTAWLEDNPGPWPWEQMNSWLEWASGDMDPAFRRAADRHWRWMQPLTYYQIHGIEQGRQWAVLGYLACRYARDFTVPELADQLQEVMEESPQDRRHPWTRRHALDIAARAKRFTGRADAAWQASEQLAWALAAGRAAQDSRPWAAGAGRAGRKPRVRRPGVRA